MDEILLSYKIGGIISLIMKEMLFRNNDVPEVLVISIDKKNRSRRKKAKELRNVKLINAT